VHPLAAIGRRIDERSVVLVRARSIGADPPICDARGAVARRPVLPNSRDAGTVFVVVRPEGEPLRVRRAAAGAMVEIVRDAHPVREPDFRVRTAQIEALFGGGIFADRLGAMSEG